ncbi:MAG: alkaline phosphatase D family protein [Planctomycetaceae bacterium]|nr:alkaline phosphatase D family protein [Planctomycetaceae bacterium]
MVLIFPTMAPGQTEQQSSGYFAMGAMSGEVTADSVLLQTRLAAIPGPETGTDGDVPGKRGQLYFEVSPDRELKEPLTTGRYLAEASSDFIVRAKISGLQPNTRYYYRAVLVDGSGDLQHGKTCQFRTLPPIDSTEPIHFCMGSCMNYHSFMTGKANGGGPVTATDEDKQLGYPAFAAMNALSPDFFIGTGDIVYYDHPAKTAATTLPELRRKWHEQFRFPRLVTFFSNTPAYWSKDDHDFRFNDADLSGRKSPDAATGIDLFREQVPILPADDTTSPTYRTHRVNKYLQLWFVEGRDYRSSNREPDGPDKTIWGEDQLNWLRQTLKQSDARWKIIVTPTPMVGPDRASKKDNHTNPGGFRHEGTAFLNWVQQELDGPVFTFCGDRHWQYHSIHPSGVEEFCCGALNDENSIRGTRPGDKGSTDPDAEIRQPYIYDEPTGGFLHVLVTTRDDGVGELTIEHRNDQGQILNSVVRRTTDQH